MENPKECFNAIKSRLAKMNGVIEGNMMSSPGLKYNDKVFAFLALEFTQTLK